MRSLSGYERISDADELVLIGAELGKSRLSGLWELQGENGIGIVRGAGQSTAVKLHNLTGESQTDAAAATIFPGGIEWQENLFNLIIGNLRAVVCDSDAGFAAGSGS